MEWLYLTLLCQISFFILGMTYGRYKLYCSNWIPVIIRRKISLSYSTIIGIGCTEIIKVVSNDLFLLFNRLFTVVLLVTLLFACQEMPEGRRIEKIQLKYQGKWFKPNDLKLVSTYEVTWLFSFNNWCLKSYFLCYKLSFFIQDYFHVRVMKIMA